MTKACAALFSAALLAGCVTRSVFVGAFPSYPE